MGRLSKLRLTFFDILIPLWALYLGNPCYSGKQQIFKGRASESEE